jgi:hypothetical protein
VRYGIVINMDYAHHSHKTIAALFRKIRDALKDEGFRMDGRVFTIQRSSQEASRLARQVLERVDEDIEGSLYGYIREFYGFDIGSVKNLLIPEDQALSVEEHDPAVVIEEIHLAAM